MKLWEKVSIFMLCIVASTVFAAAAEPADVPLDSTAFPDPAFLQWSQQKDTDGDGFLSQSELDAVTSIDLRKRGIQDLTGLEHFHALKTLNCSENDLTSLVLRDFPFLTSLTCNENPQLATLDLHVRPLCSICTAFTPIYLSLTCMLCLIWPILSGAAARCKNWI